MPDLVPQRDPEPDPRRKRAFILGGALLGAIVLWQGPWWGDDDDHAVITTDDAESGEEIRARVRDEIREELREAGIDADEAIDEAVDEAAETANEAVVDARGVRIERDEDGGGVTINVNPADGNDDGR
ncbi:MAG: hypothetical protein H7X93_10715 [Sphingomonadaceae bacterium]|nr:hypothetical protein [Sphingomonadaceae bacterium]